MESTRFKAKTPDEYYASLPEDAKSTLMTMRGYILAAAPESKEVISYDIPTFKLEKGFICIAAFKKHCSFFPGLAVIENHAKELEGFDVRHGTIRYPIGKPMPKALVTKLVKAKVQEGKDKAARAK